MEGSQDQGNVSEGARVLVVPERRAEYLDIQGQGLGFHYTLDSALPGIFQHGLISPREERMRDLDTRIIKDPVGDPNLVYFTTDIHDYHYRLLRDEGNSDQPREDMVGIVIKKPGNLKREGHFTVSKVVNSDKIKALVVIDEKLFDSNAADPLQEEVMPRVNSVRRICEQNGVNIPIYGVSGDMYWPERKSKEEIAELLRSK